jgi:hypothetical protein
MLKTLTMAVLVATLQLLLGTNEAAAQRETGNSGYCPAGTCSKSGGPTATNVKNCRNENCRR